jgi:hypothetical protein
VVKVYVKNLWKLFQEILLQLPWDVEEKEGEQGVTDKGEMIR